MLAIRSKRSRLQEWPLRSKHQIRIQQRLHQNSKCQRRWWHLLDTSTQLRSLLAVVVTSLATAATIAMIDSSCSIYFAGHWPLTTLLSTQPCSDALCNSTSCSSKLCAPIYNSTRRASQTRLSIIKGIQIPHQLNHSGAYHQDMKDRMGAPQVEFTRVSTFWKPSLQPNIGQVMLFPMFEIVRLTV